MVGDSKRKINKAMTYKTNNLLGLLIKKGGVMRVLYRDSISTVLAVVGAVVMFAKLQSYSWWLIGSWTGAVGVLAVLGLAILLTNVVEIYKLADGAALAEFSAWILAATVTIASLFYATTRSEFIWSGALIGFAWLAQVTRHVWRKTHAHTNQHHYMPVT